MDVDFGVDFDFGSAFSLGKAFSLGICSLSGNLDFLTNENAPATRGQAAQREEEVCPWPCTWNSEFLGRQFTDGDPTFPATPCCACGMQCRIFKNAEFLSF